MDIKNRFFRHVKKSSKCWLWTGARDRKINGYGRIKIGPKKQSEAHRISWEIHYGPINDKWVLHKCDVRLCVRPDHLFLGNVSDNTRDMVKKGRQARGENINTCKLSESDVIEIRNLRKSGISPYRIAKDFGVGYTCIQKIVNGTNWKHVPLP